MGQTPFVQPYPPQPPYPYYPPVNPIAGPVKVFGVIYAVLAVLSFFGVITMAAMSGFLMQSQTHPIDGVDGRVAPLFVILGVIILVAAVLHGATAYGLLARKSWGRILAIVVSIFSLISIPFGTILGAFTLYFLMRHGAEQDYERLTLEQP